MNVEEWVEYKKSYVPNNWSEEKKKQYDLVNRLEYEIHYSTEYGSLTHQEMIKDYLENLSKMHDMDKVKQN